MEDKNKSEISQTDIEAGLNRLGLKLGNIVEVHSSLSSIGKVQGGPTAVINALINAVGSNGTIIMSAYPLTAPIPLTSEEKARGIQWKTKVLREDSTERTGMGIVVDEFKSRPDVFCGHGIHRICAWGHESEKHKDSLKYLLEKNGWALLIGVDIDRCSSLHLAEEIPVPEEMNKFEEIPADILKDYPPDKWCVGFGKGTPEDAWEKVYQKADEQDLIKKTKIGNADCKLFKVKALVDIFKEWRRNDPYSLYGVGK